MEWAVESGDADIACAIAGGLGWFWNMGGRIDDTWRWITDRALARRAGRSRPADPRASHGRARSASSHDSERAIDYGAEAVERARALGDAGALAIATMLHGFGHLRLLPAPGPVGTAAPRSRGDAFVAVGDDWSLAMAALLRGA